MSIYKNNKENTSVCKANSVCIVGERKYKEWRKNDNFVFHLVISGWG